MYMDLVRRYQNTFNGFVGPTETLVSGNTLQLKDYFKTDWEWTYFDVPSKIARHETVFPQECAKAYELGKKLFQ